MHGRSGDMRGIDLRFGRDQPAGHQGPRQLLGFRGKWKHLTLGHRRHTRRGRYGIALPDFIQHQDRNVKLILPSALLPPIAGGLLLPRNDQITVRPRGEQAGNGGLDIDGRFHRRASFFGPERGCFEVLEGRAFRGAHFRKKVEARDALDFADGGEVLGDPRFPLRAGVIQKRQKDEG